LVNWIGYSPPPKRRDHQPALRAAGSAELSGAATGSTGCAGDGVWGATMAGVSAAGALVLPKLTFSRTVERRGAGLSSSSTAGSDADAVAGSAIAGSG